MGQLAHEWIENFADFEVVLLCKNDLDPWDKESCLRAFQTFGWDDASTPGNDVTFRHESTAAMVRHDGAVVAIEYGVAAKWREALSDLISVLHALGWTLAEVFHPPQTISGLLSDIGKAIPANMDFDVKPTKAGREVSSFAETEMLISRGRDILQHQGAGEQDDIVRTALESMGEGDAGNNPFQSMTLDDDVPLKPWQDGQDSGEQPRVFVLPTIASVMVPSESELPSRMVPLTDVSDEGHIQSQAALVIENESLREDVTATSRRALFAENDAARLNRELGEAKDAAIEARRRHDALVVENLSLRSQSPSAKETLEEATVPFNRGEQAPKDSPMADVINVGLSAFCFDLPGAPLSDEVMKQIADQCGAQEVVHLRPGAIAESMRWDVLGEVVPEYPWFAEKLAGAMNFGGVHGPLVASLVLALKQAVPYAQLRDVVLSCKPNLGLNVAEDAPELGMLSAWVMSSDFDGLAQAMMQRLGSLLLCPEGKAFVDVRAAADSVAGTHESFTVRGLMQSQLAQLFVVHVDALDGSFVTSIVDLLRSVANAHAASKVFRKTVLVKVEKVEAETPKDAELNNLVVRLRELGIAV